MQVNTSNVGAFEQVWSKLKTTRFSGSFDYADPSGSFCQTVDDHFRRVDQTARYGVYVVRRAVDNEIVYIGKGGTIRGDGTFKKQNVHGRLKAVRGDTRSDPWFASACSVCGALRVEYVFLTASPVSPALAEVWLLQAFLNEKRRLPRYNSEF
jgi:hypothetical protein